MMFRSTISSLLALSSRILPWAASLPLVPGRSPAEREIENLQFRLKHSIDNIRALELTEPDIAHQGPLAELIEMVTNIKGQLERIESTATLFGKSATGTLQSREQRVTKHPRRRMIRPTHESPERRIARRLLERGVSHADTARKTMLPIEVVKQLDGSLRKAREAPQHSPDQAFEIERSQVLL